MTSFLNTTAAHNANGGCDQTASHNIQATALDSNLNSNLRVVVVVHEHRTYSVLCAHR